MLTLDLIRLERDGALPVEAEIPSDSPLWEDSGLRFRGPVEVEGQATLAGSGQVLLDVTIRGEWDQECRRCLAAVRTPVELEAMLVYGDAGEEADGDDGQIRPADLNANTLDYGLGIREELLLAHDPYVLCDPDCKGLCPVCGADRNRESCDCTLEEPDPRWDALRQLKEE